jgi:hypothetical protein
LVESSSLLFRSVFILPSNAFLVTSLSGR